MRSSGQFIAVLLFLIALTSCAPALQRLQNMVKPPQAFYRQKALAFEKEEKLQQAILCWRIVAHMDKTNGQAPKSIRTLKLTAAKTAQVHFKQGVDQYRAGDLNKALREFLIAIRLNPEHQQARHYLKNRLQNPEQAIYRVKPGDSFIRIAGNVYKDPSKAYMMAYFNDMDPKKPLMIGTDLSLPALGAEYLVPRSDIRAMLEKARKAYEKRRYHRVYTLTDAVRKEIPGHLRALKLADAARFDQGTALMNQKQYLAAIEQFKQVSPQHKGRDRAIAKARNRINRQAIDQKLDAARGHLKRKAWASVINVSEEILEQEPGNDQAKMLFSNASYQLGKILLDRGETAGAIEVLSRIEPTYEDTGQLLALARARLKSQAETFYRDGVKHFINEDLEKAIKIWNKTLELNPDHPKARQDMENAQRLLEKFRALDKEPQ